MDLIYVVTIGSPGYGLVNELYSLFNGIIIARAEHRAIVMCDDFSRDVSQHSYCPDGEYCPLGEVIDLVHLNNITKSLGIVVYDRMTPIQVVTVKYGTYQQFIDVTDEIKARFVKNNALFIPQNFDLNNLKGDPHSGKIKQLFVTYEVNGTQYLCVYPEKRYEPIHPGMGQLHRGSVANYVNELEIRMFHNLMKQFRFTSRYYEFAQKFIDTLTIGPISVIHVRNEDDALDFWSKINHMPREAFEVQLNQKYISMIQKYISREEHLIVLTARTNSPVIDFLELNGYNYHLGKKDHVKGRECNAIIDLLIGEHCTKTFIGSVNPNNRHGSTFSYILWQRLPTTVKSILLDLDDINHDEYA